VYEARDLHFQRRLVAIKMIRTGANPGPEQLARFRAEAEALARLQHPHIVQIYTVGEHAGQPFLVMEYVEGGSLYGKLNRKPQPIASAAQLVEVLARAVHAAHVKQIIHRDLKPANVLLAPASDGGPWNTAYGLPKVADFGLARLADAGLVQSVEGAVIGTPSYMAPEQAGGRSREIGPATDIYALGTILYELLTGRPPFQGESVLAVMAQVCNVPPAPVRLSRPDVPEALEKICLRCLEKAPAARYATALALADDLRRFTAEPITKPRKRRVNGTRRRRLAAAGALLLGLALITTLLWFRHSSGGPEPEKSPLKAEIEGLVWASQLADSDHFIPGDPHRQRRLIQDVVPLTLRDWVRFEVRTNRPAFLYLIWIDTEGRATPLYPWVEYDWQQRPECEESRDRLSEPQKDDGMTRLTAGPPGIETLLLLARDAPLSAEDHAALIEMFRKPQLRRPLADLHIALWLENGERTTDDRERGPPALHLAESSADPELQVKSLTRQLRSMFAYSRALCFGNEGKTPEPKRMKGISPWDWPLMWLGFKSRPQGNPK
jgi:serine/threonine protein kinase